MKKLILFLVVFVFSIPAFSRDKEWTIMVFMNGDNDLYQFAYSDIREMISAGYSKHVNVVVQHDDFDTHTAQRLFIYKDNVRVIEDMGTIDMGDYRELYKFIVWGAATFPAKKYMVVVWNHGSGWLKGISHDYHSKNHISIPDLRKAFVMAGVPIEIVGFDACLMNMLEVAYEIKDITRYVVGSQETEPGDGWPYDTVLKTLYEYPFMSAEDFAATIVDNYAESYKGQTWYGVTQSALRVDLLDDVMHFIDIIALDLLYFIQNEKYREAIFKAAEETQRFEMSAYADIIDFLYRVIAYLEKEDKQRFAERVETLRLVLDAMIIRNYSNINYFGAFGMSIYLPGIASYRYNSGRYKELLFSRDGNWDEFLDHLLSY